MVQPLKIPGLTEGSAVHADLSAKSNGPDKDEYLFLIGQIDKGEEDVEEARARLKKIRQHAMNRGVDLEMSDRAREERERNDNTTAQKLKKFALYCQFLELPVGSQIKLFDGPASATEIAANEKTLADKAHADGFERGVSGKNPDEQKWQPNTPEGQRHIEGWNQGQDVMKQKFLAMNEEMAAAEAAELKEKADKAAAKKAKAAAKSAKSAPTESAAA